MAKGNFGALKQQTPIKNDLGELAIQREQIESQKKEQKRTAARQNAQDARTKSLDQQRESDRKVNLLSGMKDVFTDVKSVDEGLAIGVSQASEELLLNDDALKLDPHNVKLQLRQAELLKYSENLTRMTKTYGAYTTDFVEGMASGKYSHSQNQAIASDMSNIHKNNNFTAGVGEDGKPIVNVGNFENGKLTGVKQVSFGEYFDGSYMPSPVLGFDKIKWLGDIKKTSGSAEWKEEQADFITKGGKGLNQTSKDNIQTGINGLIGEAGDPTAQGRGIWEDEYELDAKDFDQEKLREMLTSDAEGQFDTKSTKDIDQVGKRLAAKEKKEAAESGVTLITKKGGGAEEFKDPRKGVLDQGGTIGIQIDGKPREINIGGEKYKVQSYFVDSKNNISIKGQKLVTIPAIPKKAANMVDGKYVPEQAGVPARKEWQPMTSETIEDVADLASELNVDGYDGLVGLARSKEAAEDKKTQEKTEGFRTKYGYGTVKTQ